jgi:hypothetical protein
MQKLQVYLQNRVLSPLLRDSKRLRIPFFIRVLSWFPFLQSIPARVIGIGFLPEQVETKAVSANRT